MFKVFFTSTDIVTTVEVARTRQIRCFWRVVSGPAKLQTLHPRQHNSTIQIHGFIRQCWHKKGVGRSSDIGRRARDKFARKVFWRLPVRLIGQD